MGGAALADGDCVAQSVSDGGDARVTVAPKHADAGLAKPTGNAAANDAVRGVSVLIIGVAGVEVEGCGVPGGVHKAFLPAAGSGVVGVRHRGDGVGERAVVEDDGLRVVTIRRTLEDGQRRHHGRAVGCAGRIARDCYSQAEIDRVIQGLLFQEGQQHGRPAPARSHVQVGSIDGVVLVIDVAGRKRADSVLVVEQREADLLQVVDALGSASRLASRLHRGQEQGDQDRDDGDHDQQLDERECWTLSAQSQGCLLPVRMW